VQLKEPNEMAAGVDVAAVSGETILGSLAQERICLFGLHFSGLFRDIR
jgi:hypothetical protein